MTSNGQQPPAPCTGTTDAGEPCRARPLTGRDVCWHHAPDLADLRDEARRRGGRNRATVARIEARMPATLAATLATLVDALDATAAGRMPASRGQAVASLGRAIAAIYSEHETETRLAEVERALGAARRGALTVVR